MTREPPNPRLTSMMSDAFTTHAPPKRPFRWGRALAAAALVPVLLIVVLFFSLGGKSDTGEAVIVTSSDYYRVIPISFDLKITATGELESKNQVEVKSRVNGRPAIIEIVPEGSRVKAGDVLIRLDLDETTEKLDQARLAEEQARASKISAEQELAIEISEAESARRAAEVTYSLAELTLLRWRKGDLVQERNELDLAINKAVRRLERAKRDYILSQELYTQKFISLNELEDAELEQIDATQALATAELDKEIYNNYEFVKDEQEYKSDVEQAKAELERTLSKNESSLEKMRSNVASETLQYQIRVQRRVDLEQQLVNSTITAPQDGLVVYATSVGSNRRGEPIAEGRSVRLGETLILLPDTRSMVATVRVHEALISQVEEGQSATLTIDARAGAPVQGQVISKAVTPDDGGWWNPNLREYRVRIELPEGIEGLKPAMRCTGDIFTGRVEHALAVPIQAVFTEGDQRFCYVPSGSRVRRQPVQIGRASDTLVEIVSGLEEGDRVLIRDPRPGEVINQTAAATP